jgi:three-Cys-motif partner protein
LATPTETLWNRDLHTAAKHQMLSSYLQAWFPIISSSFGPAGLTYVDAFAGPGEYTAGEPGSPLIALAQARRPDVVGHGRPLRLLFIEYRKDRVDRLVKLIDARYPAASRPNNWALQVVQGRCEDLLIPALFDIGAAQAPIFANFDGWGVDTPLALVRHVGRYPSPEVLITFHAQWFVRFATQHDVTAGDIVFGGKDWRPIAATGTPEEKKRGLIDLYRRKLVEAKFEYSLVFEMIDEGGHELLLVYGTGSERGLEKMKDAM